MKKLNEIVSKNTEEYGIYRDYEIYKEQIDQLDLYKSKFLTLFSLVESFAQDYNLENKLTGNKNIFIKFISDFAIKKDKKYEELNKYDAVHLYNKYKDKYFQNITLELNDENLLEKFKYIIDKTLENVKGKEIKKYKNVSLIYSYRNKLSHEFRYQNDFHPHNLMNFDQLHCYYIELKEEKDILRYNCKIGLLFSFKYLKDLFYFAIENYFDYCESKGGYPFKNKKIIVDLTEY